MSHMLRSAGYGRVFSLFWMDMVSLRWIGPVVRSLWLPWHGQWRRVWRRWEGKSAEGEGQGREGWGVKDEEGWRVRREPAEPAFYNISNKQFMTSPCSQAQSCRPHQASPGPAMHTQARRGLTRPNKAQSDPARSNQAQSGPYKTNQAHPDPTRPNQARPGLTLPVQA